MSSLQSTHRRETFIVLTLSLLLGAGVFLYLLLIGGAAFLAMLLALLAGTVFLGLHYLVWGHQSLRESSGLDEEMD